MEEVDEPTEKVELKRWSLWYWAKGKTAIAALFPVTDTTILLQGHCGRIYSFHDTSNSESSQNFGPRNCIGRKWELFEKLFSFNNRKTVSADKTQI